MGIISNIIVYSMAILMDIVGLYYFVKLLKEDRQMIREMKERGEL